MRKSIPVYESKKSKDELKKIDLIEKVLKELNTKASNRLKLIKADLEMGDSTVSLGALDDLAVQLSDAVTALSKL